MDHDGVTNDTLRSLALGDGPAAARQAILGTDRTCSPALLALASLAAFWDGDFASAHEDGTAAMERATPAQRPLALAAHAFSLAGLAGAWHPGVDDVFAELASTTSGTSRAEALARYVAAEAALACARVDDAAQILGDHAPTSQSWADHPFAVVMQASAIRIAAFAGRISTAAALLPQLHRLVEDTASGTRLVGLAGSVDDLIRGNGSPEPARGDLHPPPTRPVDYLDRGACLLTAYGAIAAGNSAVAAAMTLRAGDEANLDRVPIIDRALGLELLVVAALGDGDIDAATAWEIQVAPIAEHPIARPTVNRLRSRIALALGDSAEAVRLAESSITECRVHHRAVETAESEVVLARAHIADQHVSEATRRLRALVLDSDASGHTSVRRSAARTLGAAGRRLPPLAHGGWDALSEREREVGQLVLSGHEIVQIARELYVSPHTVRGHVSRVLGAFGVATRVGLLDAAGGSVADPRAAHLPPLTARQGQVTALIALGRSNQQIADCLGVTVKSVEKHASDAMRRWNVLTRFELARLWRSGGAATHGQTHGEDQQAGESETGADDAGRVVAEPGRDHH